MRRTNLGRREAGALGAEMARPAGSDGQRHAARRGRWMGLRTVMVSPLLAEETQSLIDPVLRPVVLPEVGGLQCRMKH